MNPLDDMPKVRKVLYFFQWLYNGAAVVAGGYFTLNQTDIDHLPKWYVLGIGLGPIVWTYLGLTAQKNVNTDPPPTDN